MRRPFLVRPAVAGALCGVLLGAAGCAMPLGERTNCRLPGLPVVARQGDDGPVHRQRLVSVGADRVVLVEQVLADGRPPSRWRLTLDRRGTVLSRTALPTTTPLRANPPGHPLPVTTGERTLGATRRGGTVRVTLAGDGHQAVLARLPDAGAVTLGQVVLGPGDPATLAVLPWRARHGAIEVEGLAVLDLRRGHARLEVEAGLAAHRRRDFARARDLFATATRRDPTYADAAYDLACALVRLGRGAEALPWLRRAFDLAPHRLRRLAAEDPDLDPLRGNPTFRRLAGPRSGRGAASPGSH